MLASMILKKFVISIAISIISAASYSYTYAKPMENNSASKSLEQGFRGIPWGTTKVSLIMEKCFKSAHSDWTRDKADYVLFYNFDPDVKSIIKTAWTTGAIYSFRNNLTDKEKSDIMRKIECYENPNDNLSLGKNIKLEKIHYIVNDGYFVGAILDIDYERTMKRINSTTSGINSRSINDEIQAFFPNLKFTEMGRHNSSGLEYVAKINKYVKVCYNNFRIVILRMNELVQDALDSYIVELKERNARRDAMTDGGF